MVFIKAQFYNYVFQQRIMDIDIRGGSKESNGRFDGIRRSCLSSGKQDGECRNLIKWGEDANYKFIKTLDLKFGSVKEMLTKNQMKQISGGQLAACTWYWNSDNGCAGGTTITTGTQAEAECNCLVNDCCDNVDCV